MKPGGDFVLVAIFVFDYGDFCLDSFLGLSFECRTGIEKLSSEREREREREKRKE